jgi:hypothetical protein
MDGEVFEEERGQRRRRDQARGEVCFNQLGADRPRAGAEMQMGLARGAAAGRVPVVGEDLAAVGIIERVHIAGRVRSPACRARCGIVN